MIFPMYFILRSLKMVPQSLDLDSLTNILADRFNIKFLTVGSGTGTALSDKLDKFSVTERATLVTRESTIHFTTERTESFRGTAVVLTLFFLFLVGFCLGLLQTLEMMAIFHTCMFCLDKICESLDVPS